MDLAETNNETKQIKASEMTLGEICELEKAIDVGDLQARQMLDDAARADGYIDYADLLEQEQKKSEEITKQDFQQNARSDIEIVVTSAGAVLNLDDLPDSPVTSAEVRKVVASFAAITPDLERIESNLREIMRAAVAPGVDNIMRDLGATMCATIAPDLDIVTRGWREAMQTMYAPVLDDLARASREAMQTMYAPVLDNIARDLREAMPTMANLDLGFARASAWSKATPGISQAAMSQFATMRDSRFSQVPLATVRQAKLQYGAPASIAPTKRDVSLRLSQAFFQWETLTWENDADLEKAFLEFLQRPEVRNNRFVRAVISRHSLLTLVGWMKDEMNGKRKSDLTNRGRQTKPRKRGMNDDTRFKMKRLCKIRWESIKDGKITIAFTTACERVGIDPDTVRANARELRTRWDDATYNAEFAE